MQADSLITKLKLMIMTTIIYITKLLDSDWPRAYNVNYVVLLSKAAFI